jgi:thiamine pyrophosphate-dependent acetolactate synthase large subunit-like protein
MRDLYKQLLDGRLSRRGFLQELAVFGVTASSASTLLTNTVEAAPGRAEPPGRTFTGNGSDLLAETLIEADALHVFHGCGAGINRFFDSFVTRPEFKNFLATNEGQCVAMAEGFHIASGGKLGVVIIPKPGLPNAAGNILNAMANRSAVLVLTARESDITSERRGNNELVEWDDVMQPFTKWLYKMDRAERVPEFTRRAIKVAHAPLGGPTFLGMTEDLYETEATATIMPQEMFQVEGKIMPDPDQVKELAKLLLEAEKPLIVAGLQVTKSDAQRDLIELAELLGVPVSQGFSLFADFPNQHPLSLGIFTKYSGFNRNVDLCVLLGTQMPEESNYLTTGPLPKTASVVQVSMDPDMLAMAQPTELSMMADVGETLSAVLKEVKSAASKRVFKAKRKARYEVAAGYIASQRERTEKRARRSWEQSPMTNARLASELDAALDKDAIVVSEAIFGVAEWFDFGPDTKWQIGPQPGEVLGWATGVATGAKLAQPDKQVVALSGDGAIMFQHNLWAISRYRAPVLLVIFNNRAYNMNRAFGWLRGGAQAELKKDLLTYLGDPDMNFALMAQAHGIDGEVVMDQADLAAAIQRGIASTRAGKPYLLDVFTERWGAGGEHEWHPDISIADMRTKQV